MTEYQKDYVREQLHDIEYLIKSGEYYAAIIATHKLSAYIDASYGE